jgi:membrane protein DedA with SNARE-associated domain
MGADPSFFNQIGTFLARMHNETGSAFDFVRPWLQHYGLWALALGLFAETFLFTGIVVPGFALLVTSGYLVADGTFSPLPTLLAAWAGAVCGDQCGYWLGFLWGNRLLGKRLHLANHLQQLLNREGYWLLLLYHYIPAFRTIFPVVVGSSCYNVRKWMFFDTVGVCIWVVAILTLGYTVHDAITQHSVVSRILNVLTLSLILVITWRIYRTLTRPEPIEEHPGNSPAVGNE